MLEVECVYKTSKFSVPMSEVLITVSVQWGVSVYLFGNNGFLKVEFPFFYQVFSVPSRVFAILSTSNETRKLLTM